MAKNQDFGKEFQEIDLDILQVSNLNVRSSTNAEKNLDELVNSIKEKGLIFPIVVRPIDNNKDGKKYEVIAGQRRFLAYQRLKKLDSKKYSKILCRIMELTDLEAKVVSLHENLNQQKLPFSDEVRLANEFYKEYMNVETVAKIMAIGRTKVYELLEDKIIPDEVLKLVDQGKLSSKKKAIRIAKLYYPDEAKIIEMANKAVNLINEELDNAINIATENKSLNVEEVIKESKKPRNKKQIILEFDLKFWEGLEKAKEERGVDSIELLIKVALEEWLGEQEYL